MTEEEPRPRPHDHLVEPFFGGLGVEGCSPEEPVPARRGSWLARLRGWFRTLWSGRP